MFKIPLNLCKVNGSFIKRINISQLNTQNFTDFKFMSYSLLIEKKTYVLLAFYYNNTETIN